MNQAINVNQETPKQRKTRLMMEEVFYKFLFYLASLGDADGNDFSKLPDSTLDIYKKSDQMQGQPPSLITFSLATQFGTVWQQLQLFINKKVCEDVVYESVVSFLDDFFANKTVKRKISPAVKFFLGEVEEYDDSQYKTFTDAFKSLVNEVLARKTFMFYREQLLSYAMMSFYTAPVHILNERWRANLLTEEEILSMLKTKNENAAEEQTRKDLIAEYKAKAVYMLNNEKPWYSKYAISKHISLLKNQGNEVNHLAIISYLFDELVKLEKTENCNLSLKRSLNLDFAGSHNFENKQINDVVKKYFPAKYYEDRMVACMFEQTLLGQEIDYDTLKFWRVVFENTHQEYAESLILLMNHAGDKFVRNAFLNPEFRQNVIERPEIIEPLIVLAAFDRNSFERYKGETNVNNIISDRIYVLCKNVFDKLTLEKKYQITTQKSKSLNAALASTEFLNYSFIYPENVAILSELAGKYPKVFGNKYYSWRQKSMVAKALLPMGLNANDFNAITLERFLRVCKTPEEFRVAYLLWQNTNFINQFWLMDKITHEDLVAIVQNVGDVINKENLPNRIKEIYKEWPAFAKKGWFADKYSSKEVNEQNSENVESIQAQVEVEEDNETVDGLKEKVEKVEKVINFFGAKMVSSDRETLRDNLSYLDRDNLEHIRTLFGDSSGEEDKVLDYINIILKMGSGKETRTQKNEYVKELFEDNLLRKAILVDANFGLDKIKAIHEFSSANNLFRGKDIKIYFHLLDAAVKSDFIEDGEEIKALLDYFFKRCEPKDKECYLAQPDTGINEFHKMYKSDYYKIIEIIEEKKGKISDVNKFSSIFEKVRDNKLQELKREEIKLINKKAELAATLAVYRKLRVDNFKGKEGYVVSDDFVCKLEKKAQDEGATLSL